MGKPHLYYCTERTIYFMLRSNISTSNISFSTFFQCAWISSDVIWYWCFCFQQVRDEWQRAAVLPVEKISPPDNYACSYGVSWSNGARLEANITRRSSRSNVQHFLSSGSSCLRSPCTERQEKTYRDNLISESVDFIVIADFHVYKLYEWNCFRKENQNNIN